MRWLTFILGVGSFLVAAKAHGRQLRLERELAGYWEVSFGARNPAFVEGLWRRERWYFWSVAVVTAIAVVVFRGWKRSFVDLVVQNVGVPLIVAFVATGLASAARFAWAVRAGAASAGTRPRDWLSSAAWGSVGWWALALTLGAALLALAWRKTA